MGRAGVRLLVHVYRPHSLTMTTRPPDPEADESEPPELVPLDSREPPSVELWSAVGDIQPWATVLLVLAWGLLFMVLAIRHQIGESSALLDWGASATGLGPFDSAWRLLASTFVHAGGAHALSNAISMLILGPAVERIFTRSGFLVLFVTGGCGASLASLAWRAWLHGSERTLSVGASGAIFALGGALLVSAYRLRHRLPPTRARALAGALAILVSQGLVAGVTRQRHRQHRPCRGTRDRRRARSLDPHEPAPRRQTTGPRDARTRDTRRPGARRLSLALAVRGGITRG